MKRYSDEFGLLDYDEDIYEEAMEEDYSDSINEVGHMYEYAQRQKSKRKYHDKFNECEDDDFDYVQSLTELPIFKTEVDGEPFEVNLWDLGRGKRSDFRPPMMATPRGINAIERNALDREESKCLNYEKEKIKDLKRTADILAKRFAKKDKTNPINLKRDFKFENK